MSLMSRLFLVVSLCCYCCMIEGFPNFPDISRTSVGLASKINGANKSVLNQFEQSKLSYMSNIRGNSDESRLQAISYVKNNADTTDVNSIIDFLNANESLAATLNFNTNCSKLNLTSEQCEEDCNIYLNLFTLFDLLETNETYKFIQYVGFTSYSGSPLVAFDNGNYDMCLYIYGTYCYTPAEYGTYAIYQHGCCIPGNCTGEDAVKVVKEDLFCYQGFADTYGYLVTSVYGGDVGVYCEALPRKFDAFAIIVILIFLIFLFLVCITSVYKQLIVIERAHIIFFGRDSVDSSQDFLRIDNNSALSGRGSINSANNAQNVMAQFTDTKYNKFKKIESNGAMNKFVGIFCIQDSWKNFVSARKNKDLNFLDGIRWWSMCWVVFGHAFFFNLYSGLNNERTVFPIDALKPARTDWNYDINDFYTTFALQGFFSVDSFFWLSGFLACWSVLKLVQKFGKMWYDYGLVLPIAYVFRYLRLAPMMIYVTLLNWKISDQLPEGPHVVTRDAYGTPCSENWYRVFFMFANLYNLNENETEGCMGHLWYIQCDMEMFLALPILVILYHKSPKIGIFCTLLSFLLCVGIRIFYGYYYHFAANLILPSVASIHGGSEGNDSYYKPWTRMGPYWAGVLCMMLFQSTYSRFRLTKAQYWMLSASAAFILCSLTFWPYGDVVDAPAERWGLYQNIWYYALSRPGWGVGLSLLAYSIRFGMRKDVDSGKNKKNSGKKENKEVERYVIIGREEMISCAISDDSYLNDESVLVWENYMLSKYLLSAEIYQPLAKLTYTMYLVHILVYEWYLSDLETSVTYSPWQVFYFWCGTMVVTFIISVILWLVMERPMANMVTLLMKAMLGGGNNSNHNSNKNDKYSNDNNYNNNNEHGNGAQGEYGANYGYKANGTGTLLNNANEHGNGNYYDAQYPSAPVPGAYAVPNGYDSSNYNHYNNNNVSLTGAAQLNHNRDNRDVSVGVGNGHHTLESQRGYGDSMQ